MKRYTQQEREELVELVGQETIQEMDFLLYGPGKFYRQDEDRWEEVEGEHLSQEERIGSWNHFTECLPEKVVFNLNVPHLSSDPKVKQDLVMHHTLERKGYVPENLSGYDFSGYRAVGLTRLDNADLIGTDLRFSEVDRGFYIRNSNLTDANMEGLHLDMPTLWGDKFYRTNMRNMRIESGYFLKSEFIDADLTGSYIEGMMVGTKWKGDYRNVEFGSCKVNGADFREAQLRPEQLDGFFLADDIPDGVKLPDGLKQYRHKVKDYRKVKGGIM